MSSLSTLEKKKIETLLEMNSGYVLDFTNNEFRDFILESLNIDIYDEKYEQYGNSKAKRLRAFWNQERDCIVGKLIADLLEYKKTQYLIKGIELNATENTLCDEVSSVVVRLINSQPEKDNTLPSKKNISILEMEGKTSILLLSADPTDASRLRIGEEFREIQEKLQLAKLRDKFTIHHKMSVRPEDISQALLDIKPEILHFSGHGTASGELCFENKTGQIQPVNPGALAALFKEFSELVKCVLLNSCYSQVQATAIAEHVEYVIGMNQWIGDKAAIAFAIGFYQALGAGYAIEKAYELGCVQIRLQDIPEHLIPVLINRR